MNLKSLLLSSDDKTVRVLRRVLSDLEIDVEHCSSADAAIRRITRQRFEAIIVDGVNAEEAGNVLRGAKAAPVNKRALAIVLVESPVGLKGGFEMGAHFVLHKPLAVERAKASFRAVRALMKRERRLQMRVPVQIPIECFGSSYLRYQATTLDLCEGGMAIQFSGRVAKGNSLRFSLELPGMKQRLEIHGEMAWEGDSHQAGVRFMNATDEQRATLRQWLKQPSSRAGAGRPTRELPSQRPQPRRLLSHDKLTVPEGHACHPFDQDRRPGSSRWWSRAGRASGIWNGSGVSPDHGRATRSGALHDHNSAGERR